MNPRGIPKGISRLLEPHPMRTRRSASLHGKNRWRATVPCGRGQWRAMLCHGRWVRERSGQGLKTDATERVPPKWRAMLRHGRRVRERSGQGLKPDASPMRTRRSASLQTGTHPRWTRRSVSPSWPLGGMPWWQVPRRTRQSASLQTGTSPRGTRAGRAVGPQSVWPGSFQSTRSRERTTPILPWPRPSSVGWFVPA